MFESLAKSHLTIITSLLLTIPLQAQTDKAPGEKPLAEVMKRLPALEPQEALKSFEVQRGFKLELVAHEPLVSDPVDACFDEHGRMFVAQMHGYPYSFEKRPQQPAGGGKKDAGIVRMLEDTDGDGRMDRSTVFADKISWPTSVCCYDGGVFVLPFGLEKEVTKQQMADLIAFIKSIPAKSK